MGRLCPDSNLETTDQIAEAFGKCKELVCLRPVWDLDERSLSIVVPIAPRIKSLDLTYCVLPQEQLADLLGLCVNLEILQVLTNSTPSSVLQSALSGYSP